MPGTTRAELFEMDIVDALSVLLVDDTVVGDEDLARAARAVVEAHAAEVAAKYAPKRKPTMRVVRE
jgi:hypothetical protein